MIETGFNVFQLKEGTSTVNITLNIGNYYRKTFRNASCKTITLSKSELRGN